jgi:hypothetical protein
MDEKGLGKNYDPQSLWTSNLKISDKIRQLYDLPSSLPKPCSDSQEYRSMSLSYGLPETMYPRSLWYIRDLHVPSPKPLARQADALAGRDESPSILTKKVRIAHHTFVMVGSRARTASTTIPRMVHRHLQDPIV